MSGIQWRSIVLTLAYIAAGVLFIAATLQVTPAGPVHNALELVGSGLIIIAVANAFMSGPLEGRSTVAWLLLTSWAGGAAFIIAGLTEVTPTGPARQFVLFSGIGSALLLLGWRFFSEKRRAPAPLEASSADENQQDRDTRWTRDTVLTFAAIGTAGVVLYSIRYVVPSGPVEGMFRVLGAGTLIGCGSLLTGALLGFLFGIPRADDKKERRDNREQPSPAAQPSKPQPNQVSDAPVAGAGQPSLVAQAPTDAETPRSAFRVNTNLEEISDWLTKIIVGLGLINLEKFPAYFQALAAYFGASLGDVPGRDSVALALILLFLVCGFLLGYLLTRLFLAGAFTRAENPQLRQFKDALATATFLGGGTGEGGMSDARKAAISQIDLTASQIPAERLRQEVLALAAEYNATRASMQPSRERTRRLDSIVIRMQGLAKRADWVLPELVNGSSDGDHLAAVAFLQINPQPEYISWLADLFHNGTPFIMYHAAIALLKAAKTLKDREPQALKSALEKATKETLEKFPEEDKERTIKNFLEAGIKELNGNTT